MKPRNREINIFNMSLLDILCGALGTFCFMMLVLFPFYSQDKGAGKRPDVQQGVDPKTFEEAKARIQQLEDKLKEFQNYADQMESKVKQMEAKDRQRQGDIQQLQDRAQRAEMRNPLFSVAAFGGLQEGEQIQMYIESDRVGRNKTPGEKVDPTKRQGGQFTGDLEASGLSAVYAYYMIRDTPAGNYRVFLKVMKLNPGHTLTGWVVVTGNDIFESIGVQSDKDKVAIPVAVVTVADDYKCKTQVVVPAENARK